MGIALRPSPVQVLDDGVAFFLSRRLELCQRSSERHGAVLARERWLEETCVRRRSGGEQAIGARQRSSIRVYTS